MHNGPQNISTDTVKSFHCHGQKLCGFTEPGILVGTYKCVDSKMYTHEHCMSVVKLWIWKVKPKYETCGSIDVCVTNWDIMLYPKS